MKEIRNYCPVGKTETFFFTRSIGITISPGNEPLPAPPEGLRKTRLSATRFSEKSVSLQREFSPDSVRLSIIGELYRKPH